MGVPACGCSQISGFDSFGTSDQATKPKATKLAYLFPGGVPGLVGNHHFWREHPLEKLGLVNTADGRNPAPTKGMVEFPCKKNTPQKNNNKQHKKTQQQKNHVGFSVPPTWVVWFEGTGAATRWRWRHGTPPRRCRSPRRRSCRSSSLRPEPKSHEEFRASAFPPPLPHQNPTKQEFRASAVFFGPLPRYFGGKKGP